MLRQWLVQQRLALTVGLSLTIATAAVHRLGWTERVELQLYDWLVRHFSHVPACEHILHVDIDDEALTRYASWPWPRDVQGELIRLLHELGAERIVVDLVWSEPRPRELRGPMLDPYAELEGDMPLLGEWSAANQVLPDDELAAALRSVGSVYLSFYHEPKASLLQDSPLARRMAEWLRSEFGLDARAMVERLKESAELNPTDRDGCAQPDELLAEIEAVLATVKRLVGGELVADHMKGDSLPSARQIHEALLATPFERPTPDRADILAAYHRELGLRNLRRLCPPVPERLRGKLPVVHGVMPPIYQVTAVGPRVGFVNFEAQADADGSLRRIPLMVEWEGRLLEQLAFAAARDELGIRTDELAIDDAGDLRIDAGADRPAMRVQLDDRGRALINWHSACKQWQHCFAHLPVTRLLQVHDFRRSIRHNETLIQARLGEAMRLIKDDVGFAAYQAQVRRLSELRSFLHLAELKNQVDTAEARQARDEAEQLARAIDQEHDLGVRLIRETWAELETEANPDAPEIAAEYRRFREAHAIVSEIIPDIQATNRRLTDQAAQLLAQLRPMVAGKTCFLGYTATALADMVTAPPFDRMPGVMVHSQLYNSFVVGRFRTWSSPAVQTLAIFALGLSVTSVATLRGPRASLLFVISVIVTALVLNAAGLFARQDHWLQLVTGLVLTFVAWALIVMIRYLVTDRQRRRFSKAVAQYVSPAMARQIGESSQPLSFAPVEAVVTCLFTDLAGFTAMSEELGPAGTRAVLNPYLESMSAVLHRHQALINKFMGDGVFAFFNSPILPCPEHEIAACEAALDSREALFELVARHADSPLAGYFQRLQVRTGIASGRVFVGDYGSEDKLDYTCMGDVVNLAARLESANKQFATAILVCGNTRAATGDRYIFRHLGMIQVKGQRRGISVYELLGRRGQVDAAMQEHAERFDQAVLAFAHRDFQAAAAGFAECLQARPSDAAAARYLPLVRHLSANPPPTDWTGAIELTEK